MISRAGRHGGLRSARLLLPIAGVAAALVLGACGDDEEDSGDEAASGDAQQIEITVSEQGALEAPQSAEAGLAEITLDNTSEEPHDAQLLRVEGDHSAEEAGEVISSGGQEPTPDWLFAGGGVGTTPPGQTNTVTQALEPGTYYAFDTEARGGPSPDAPAIEVAGDESADVPADAPATITASEYTFETEGLSADTSEVNFENAGEQPHHIVAAPLNEGATIEDVERFAQDDSGPPPVDVEQTISTAVVEGGDSQMVDLPFEPGEYALLCFISDREGGPPHVAQGMIAAATIE